MAGRSAQLAMVRSAEHLFAEQGIDQPSLREISRHARQGNTRAVQYHFGTRENLLAAVLERHRSGVDDHRGDLLDTIDPDDVRGLATVVVHPLVAKVDDPDSGEEYLRIASEVVNRPLRHREVIHLVGSGAAMKRWSDAVAPLMDPAALGSPVHRRSATVRFAYTEVGRRARERRSADHALFEEQLVDLVAAMLTAPVSPSTLARLTRPEAPAART